jgi:hypothetical protein
MLIRQRLHNMVSRSSKPDSAARKIPVRVCCLVLVLWISGFGCFAACTDRMTGRYADKHSCCKTTKHNTDRAATILPNAPVQKLACCEHSAQSAAFSKQQLRANQFTPSSAIGKQQIKFHDATRETHQLTRTFLPDRRGTYLRDCTLLI